MSDRPAVPIDEVITLCRRLRLKYVREQVEEVVLTARAQRWDPTDVLRALLVAEAEGRDRSTIEVRRRRAHFPAGKTFDTWVESRSSIPPTAQRSLRSLEWISPPGEPGGGRTERARASRICSKRSGTPPSTCR